MSGKWVAAVALFGALAAASTGCVSKDEYDKAVTAARIARQELDSTNARLQTALMDNKNLKEQNNLLASQTKNKDDIIKQLRDANDSQMAKYNDLWEKYKVLANAEPKIVDRGATALPAEQNALMEELAKGSGGFFTWNPKLGMLQMQADLTFAPGSTEIKPEAAKALQKLAEYLNRAEFQPFNSYIAGHTDDMPLSKTETKELHGTNWGLAVHRSLAVIKLLAENRVDQARLSAMGFSKYHPVAPNAPGNKGNAANRRVEIWIVPREKFMTTGTPAEPTVSAEKEGS
jgi:flagellar motor protein MotB